MCVKSLDKLYNCFYYYLQGYMSFFFSVFLAFLQRLIFVRIFFLFQRQRRFLLVLLVVYMSSRTTNLLYLAKARRTICARLSWHIVWPIDCPPVVTDCLPACRDRLPCNLPRIDQLISTLHTKHSGIVTLPYYINSCNIYWKWIFKMSYFYREICQVIVLSFLYTDFCSSMSFSVAEDVFVDCLRVFQVH